MGEIDRLLKVQADRLRQTIVEKVQAPQVQTVSQMEERILQKLRENETELQSISKKNMDLENRMEQLRMEAWKQERGSKGLDTTNTTKHDNGPQAQSAASSCSNPR